MSEVDNDAPEAQTDEEALSEEQEIARLEAEEAEEAAAEAAERVAAVDAEANEATAEEAQDAADKATKAVASKRKALEKAKEALVKAEEEQAEALAVLRIAKPPLTTQELILKHNREFTERRRREIGAGKQVGEQIDKVQVPGSPLSY